MKYIFVLISVILVISFVFGLFVSYDKKYITDDIFVFEYRSVGTAGNRMISFFTSSIEVLGGLTSTLSRALRLVDVDSDVPFSAFGKEVSLYQLSKSTEVMFYRFKNPDKSYSYVVWIGTGVNSASYVVYSDVPFVDLPFGRRIDFQSITKDKNIFKRQRNFYIYDENNKDLLKNDNGSVSCIRDYYSFFDVGGGFCLTIGECEKSFGISILH